MDKHMSATDYVLLDSGHGRKLERVGPYLIDRQCAVAFWKPRLPASEWKKAQAFHHRSEKGGGHWEFHGKLADEWTTTYGDLQLKTKLTSFGHLGFFAEQAFEWAWLKKTVSDVVATSSVPPRLLNLFGYTGGSSLTLALAGAEVTHVDAAKGIVDWCRANAELNQVPKERLRLIVDDCTTFLKREARRGKKYDGVLLDPPSYGRGPNKEVFKIEEDITELLESIAAVLSDKPVLVHMSSHSQGFTPETLRNLLSDHFPLKGMTCEQGEMWVPESSGERKVPSGVFSRWRRS